MKNTLTDLNNHLFCQLERLGDEELTTEQIEAESKRAESIVNVAETIVDSAKTTISAMKVASENGMVLNGNNFLGLTEK